MTSNPQGFGRQRCPQLLECRDNGPAEHARLLAAYRSQGLNHAQAETFAKVSLLFLYCKAAGFREGRDFRFEINNERLWLSPLVAQWIRTCSPPSDWEQWRRDGFITEAA